MTATVRTRSTRADRTGNDLAGTTGGARSAPAGRTVLAVTTSALLALFGAVKLGATVYFGFFAAAASGGGLRSAGDWAVAAWSVLMGAGYLAVALVLGRDRGDRCVLPLAVAVTAADLAFSLVKLTVYDESGSLGFMGMSLVLLALVVLTRRSRRV